MAQKLGFWIRGSLWPRRIVAGVAMAIGALCATTHPAVAASALTGGNFTWIVTAAQNVQGGVMAVGWILVVIGVGYGGLYFMEHREDWYGAIKRLVACVVAGAVMIHAADIAALGAAGAVVSLL